MSCTYTIVGGAYKYAGARADSIFVRFYIRLKIIIGQNSRYPSVFATAEVIALKMAFSCHCRPRCFRVIYRRIAATRMAFYMFMKRILVIGPFKREGESILFWILY